MHASADRKTLLHQRRQAVAAGHLDSLTPQTAYVAQYLADAPLYWYNAAYDASELWRGMTFDIQAVRAFRDLYQVYQMRWNANRMKAPVLVVMGLHDYAVAHTLWDNVLPLLSNVTFKVLDRSGHTPQLEEPEVFDRVLLEWLGR